MLEELFLDRDGVRDVFESAGLQMLTSEIIKQTIAPNRAAYADKLSAGGYSVLSRLSRQELEAGLAALRSHVADADDETVVELVDLFVFQ